MLYSLSVPASPSAFGHLCYRQRARGRNKLRQGTGLARLSDEVWTKSSAPRTRTAKTAMCRILAGGDKAAQKEDDADELLNAAVDIILESGRPPSQCFSGA
jgi:transcriptional accessory protein Tex/SPT6